MIPPLPQPQPTPPPDRLTQSSSLARALPPHDSAPNAHSTRTGAPPRHRQNAAGGGDGGRVRRRISRACDQCNQLRTKCDGQNPCTHCIDFGLGCEYFRERKKRGKASRKNLVQQAAVKGHGRHENGAPVQEISQVDGSLSATDSQNSQNSSSAAAAPRPSGTDDTAVDNPASSSPAILDSRQPSNLDGVGLDLDGFGPTSMQFSQRQPTLGSDGPLCSIPQTSFSQTPGAFSAYPELSYALQTQSPAAYTTSLSMAGLGAFSAIDEPTSPPWMAMSPPALQLFHQPVTTMPMSGAASYDPTRLRYPVLAPLVPHLRGLLSLPLACSLIDLYFSSSSAAQLHPMSPHVLGFIFRKHSIMHPTRPRPCRPALLASMLWVAAQTSESSPLTGPPSSRAKICQKLLDLAVGLLRPLVDSSEGLPGTPATLDDIVTYIHLATVISASEYKSASMRWWNVAWSLAREMKLGRELPMNISVEDGREESEEREERRRIWWLLYIVDRHLALCYNRPLFLLDVECDGLRQPLDETAWQNGDFGLAMTDPLLTLGASNGDQSRGLSFVCRGHSIFGFFLPLMTILGEIVDLQHARNHAHLGAAFRSSRGCKDQVAAISHHLDTYGRSLRQFEQQHLSPAAHVTTGVESNDVSMSADIATTPQTVSTPSVHSAGGSGAGSESPCALTSRMTELDVQTRIVVGYGTHVMHALHVLLAGKWDPISLLDDEDQWISSPDFITATGHAVDAAEAINNILEHDPGLEFIPFFFGIYLLQGSFLLLLLADKLQLEASASVVGACETIVRAHEACAVTLNTEYQRNFSRVMRSTLAQVRGRVPPGGGGDDGGGSGSSTRGILGSAGDRRRRDLLGMYRWTGDGSGLAL